jgi:hypothetical protein
MNKKITFILVGIVFILLVALVAQTAYFIGKKDQSVIQSKTIKKTKNENEIVKKSENNKATVNGKRTEDNTSLKSNNISKENGDSATATQKNKVDDSWFWYINETTGFKIKLPKETDWSGKKYKVRTFIGGPITYISSSESVEKEILKRRNDKTMSIYDRAGGISFAILVEKVKDKKELEEFIKDRYGKECKLGSITKSTIPGTFDVGINGSGEPGGGCFINYMTVIKYSPDKNTVAAWDLGQAPNFWIKGQTNPKGSTKAFDMIISDSFEFLK